jgi:two-component sensor histidine kinase
MGNLAEDPQEWLRRQFEFEWRLEFEWRPECGRDRRHHPGQDGFGSKLNSELVAALQGILESTDADPGLRVTVTIPNPAPAGGSNRGGNLPT